MNQTTAQTDGRIVFEKSEVHFAAVHPTVLALYVPHSRRETALFPPNPFPPVFSKHAAKLREFYASHKNWCNKNNDPCNPESFDSSLVGQVAINDREHALAFAISYQHIQEVAGDAQKPDGPDKVIYVFRNVDDEARLEYREMLPSDLEVRFGIDIESLLNTASIENDFCPLALWTHQLSTL